MRSLIIYIFDVLKSYKKNHSVLSLAHQHNEIEMLFRQLPAFNDLAGQKCWTLEFWIMNYLFLRER